MTRLVWMLLVLLPGDQALPQPFNISLTQGSSGFTLTWESGPGTPPGTSYNVTSQTESGVSPSPVKGCQHVQKPLTCLLPYESIDPLERYIIQITSYLEAQMSQPAEIQFKAVDLLDLPQLTPVSCGRNLCVDLMPPFQNLQETYDQLNYQLQISSNSSGGPQVLKEFRSLTRQNLTVPVPGRIYCISIRFTNIKNIKGSIFSQPVCVSTPALFPLDQLISATLCLLVTMMVVVLVLLLWTGSICLRRSRMPTNLTSIRPLEEVLIQASTISLERFSLVAPPAGGKTSSLSSSEDSDEEGAAETSCKGSSGAGYTQRVNPTPISSSPLPSSKPPREPDAQNQFRTEASSWSSNTSSRGRSEEEEEGEMVDLDVNLLTLTFDHQEEEEEEDSSSNASDECNTPDPSVITLFPAGVSCWTAEEEEEPEEDCGYMGRGVRL
nr:interferon alpha/beta receptor 2 [Nothobranchius furzeri]